MKIAPITREMDNRGIHNILVHTGQHYDYELNKIFFDELNIKEPNYFLEVGSASQSVQTANIMIKFEEVLLKVKPDLVLVVGDVNSTLACALVATKEHYPIAHVEAGLRSNDKTMPEEINREITDRISQLLFTTSKDANENLVKEGIDKEKIHFVGNTMIDSLKIFEKEAKKIEREKKIGLKKGKYALVTIHRAENVDNPVILEKIIEMICTAKSFTEEVIFPVHPRTKKILEDNISLKKKLLRNNILLYGPLGYLEFLNLEMDAEFVLTDSGGVQEETTVLGVPCFTARKNTERPITVTEGTNTIVNLDSQLLKKELEKLKEGKGKKGKIPEKWDGKASERICNIIIENDFPKRI